MYFTDINIEPREAKTMMRKEEEDKSERGSVGFVIIFKNVLFFLMKSEEKRKKIFDIKKKAFRKLGGVLRLFIQVSSLTLVKFQWSLTFGTHCKVDHKITWQVNRKLKSSFFQIEERILTSYVSWRRQWKTSMLNFHFFTWGWRPGARATNDWPEVESRTFSLRMWLAFSARRFVFSFFCQWSITTSILIFETLTEIGTWKICSFFVILTTFNSYNLV